MKTEMVPLLAVAVCMTVLSAAADVAVEKTSTGFAVRSGDVRRTLDFYGPNTLRVKSDLGRDHWKHPSLAIVAKPSAVAAKLRETADAFVVEGAAFTVSIDRRTGALTFSDNGKVLLREPSDPCTIKEINIDGESTYEVTQRWKLEEGEGLYGLGQAASGKFNLRGQKIKIVQTNIPAFSPVWSSSKGYMILWDVYSQSIFDDKADGLSLWGESAPGGSDWYFMYGSDPDRRFAEYRMLTGAAPMFPKAAFGYFQSKERYKSAQELIDVVSRFRELGYPIDWIVQDWQYWDARNDRWNAMQWDKSRFPDPKGLCDTLHDKLHVKLITSIWPDVGDDTDVARELDSHGLRYKPGHWISKDRSHVYDAYSKLGREIYFKHLKKGLFDVGVDAMWMDGSELETRDACHNADSMVEQIKACGRNEMGDFTRYLNTYGLVTTMGNYEGRRATSDRRTFTLTRTAWAGLQRYAAIPWSGDTAASWGRLRDEIAGGLGASASGLPYWTQDTGGFFCGHYGDAMNNPAFLELLARWNQFAIFNPVYRWHVSSPVAKEPFRAKEKHPEYYASFLSAARLRYRLLPYIYSLARDVHETGRPFVRPAWIDFPGTPGATDDQTSIVFGPSLYTSIITRPVYTGHTTGSGSPVPSEMLTTPDGKAGVKVEYFKGQNHKEKVSETVVAQVNDAWPGPPLVEWPEGLTGGDDFSARYTGRLTLSEPGTYELGVEGDDGFALWLDGEEKFRDWAKRAARSKATRVTVPEGGKAFDFRIDYFNDKFARSVKFWMRTPEEVAKLERESRKIEVALPVGADWYDFRTGEKFAGGAKLQREYPIDSFPLFVKAGSVLPLGPDVQYATEKTEKPTELRVYPGADASFTLYFDDNETYAYEKGAFEKIPLKWDDAKKTLTIGAREGSFPGMPKTRAFKVVCGDFSKSVRYDGGEVVLPAVSLAARAACVADIAKARPFGLSELRLGEGVFRERQETDREYLLDVLTQDKVDRLLAEFRRVAGLPKKAERYGGLWEGKGINGHNLGHYLSAISACYAATGDRRAKERVDYVVDELAACQEANGDGYVMTIPQDAVWDKVRSGNFTAGGFDVCRWWVPNYTTHKVFAGLRDAYRLADSKKALEVERRFGDWYAKVIDNLDDEQMQRLMRAEWGGLNETFAQLYEDTGDGKFLRIAAERFNDRAVFDPLRRGEDRLDGKHANTQMPKVTGLATLYEITGDESAKKAVETYWRTVVDNRTLANGGHSDREHFYPMHDSASHLGSQTAETCNIYNLIRLSGHVFSWKPDSHVMDFVERALYNQLLANIGRRPGEFGYFISTRPVATKVFSTQEGAWWCCVGTGMENPMRYAEQIYYHDDKSLWVNLFVDSAVRWREKDVVIRQKTQYPLSEKVALEILSEKPVRFAMRIRKPFWCDSPSVAVCGAAADAQADADGYIVVDRLWKKGDGVELTLPMSMRLEELPGSRGKFAAFMYGPMVMAGITPPRKDRLDPATRRWDDHLAAPGGVEERAMTIVADSLADAARMVERVDAEEGVAFRTKGLLMPEDRVLMPFHLVYEEHYTMYFPVMSTKEWAEKAPALAREAAEKAAVAARTVDEVEPGFQQSEVNHAWKGFGDSTGDFRDRKWRHAQGRDGWFSYELAVDPKSPMELVATYFAGDRGRSFDVFVDGTLLATEPCGPDPRRDEMYEKAYRIPLGLTRGKKTVTVKFAGNPKTSFVGGLFGLASRRVPSGPAF